MRAVVTLKQHILGGQLARDCSIEELPGVVQQAVDVTLKSYEQIKDLPGLHDEMLLAYPITITFVPDDWQERAERLEKDKTAFDQHLRRNDGPISL